MAAPYLTKVFHKSPHDLLKKVLQIQLGIFISLLAVSTLVKFFGDAVLVYIYNSDYENSAEILAYLLIGASFMYCQSFSSIALTIIRALNPQLFVTSIAASASLLFCATLIPLYGLKGASAAFTISSMIICLGTNFVLLRRIKKLPQIAHL